MGTYDAWKAGEIGDDGSHPNSPSYDSRADEAIDEAADALMDDDAWLREEVSDLAGGDLLESGNDALLAVTELHRVDPSELLSALNGGTTLRDAYVEGLLVRLYVAAKQFHLAARESAERQAATGAAA